MTFYSKVHGVELRTGCTRDAAYSALLQCDGAVIRESKVTRCALEVVRHDGRLATVGKGELVGHAVHQL
jgi:hypothetical protein